MRSLQASLLIYGRDPQLLETRCLLLERSGARVWAATSLADIARVPLSVTINLVILCHSLSAEQSVHALAFTRARWPRIQSLKLVSERLGSYPNSSNQIADTTMGPAYLLDTIAKLVEAA